MPCDPYWSNVVFAAHFDSDFSDLKGHTPTVRGSATISAGDSASFGGGALYVPNTYSYARKKENLYVTTAMVGEPSLTKQDVMQAKPVEPKAVVLSKQSALAALTKRKRSMIESTN